MALRDKTNQRFKDFFEKQSKRNDGKDFELSYSEIQRGTGAANSTMKRAIESLTAEGWLEVKSGRNSRYGVFKLLQGTATIAQDSSQGVRPKPHNSETLGPVSDQDSNFEASPSIPEEVDPFKKILELEHLIDGLRRRIRTQEMTIALLQDRIAEIEDKLYRK